MYKCILFSSLNCNIMARNNYLFETNIVRKYKLTKWKRVFWVKSSLSLSLCGWVSGWVCVCVCECRCFMKTLSLFLSLSVVCCYRRFLFLFVVVFRCLLLSLIFVVVVAFVPCSCRNRQTLWKIHNCNSFCKWNNFKSNVSQKILRHKTDFSLDEGLHVLKMKLIIDK